MSLDIQCKLYIRVITEGGQMYSCCTYSISIACYDLKNDEFIDILYFFLCIMYHQQVNKEIGV